MNFTSELRNLLDGATPRPWAVEITRFSDRITTVEDSSIHIAETGNWLHGEKTEQHSNSQLIALLANHAADLLELVELGAEVETYLAKRVTGTGGHGETVLLPKIHTALAHLNGEKT